MMDHLMCVLSFALGVIVTTLTGVLIFIAVNYGAIANGL